MRRLLLLLFAAMLMLPAFPGTAENAPAPLTAVLPAEAGADARGIPAVSLGNGVMLTAWAALPEDRTDLTLVRGDARQDVKAAVPDEEGLLAVLLYDAAEGSPAAEELDVMPLGTTVAAADCRVRLPEGRDVAVLDADSLYWQGRRCLLLTLREDAPLGCPVLTPAGDLAGLLIAVWGEGPHRMLALAAEEIAGDVIAAGDKVRGLDAWGRAPEGFTVTLDKNQAVLDWSGMTLPETAEGESLYLVTADLGNRYLSYQPADEAERSLSMLTAPGRVYAAGILASRETPDRLPEELAVFVPGPAEPLTAYDFEPIETTVAERRAANGYLSAPEPVTEVTEEDLRAGRVYFYASSSYRLPEGGAPRESLLVTLTDPQGTVHCYESVWYYDPALQENDTWYISLREAELTAFLDESGYPPGVYSLAYYVGGDLAGQTAFELK